ncbi:hypothetical protein CGRA01v4_07229 [Colletotrichum graminicola]|nr:hypothetical protein CGRA01v4_07229 [Colletotrichum graminicola]
MDGLFGNVRRPNYVVASRVVDEKIFVVPMRDRVRLYGVEIAAEIGPSRCVDSFAFIYFSSSLSVVAAKAGNGGAWIV